MAPIDLPDAAYLHECFLYTPESGDLTWKIRPASHFKSHKEWLRWNKAFSRMIAGYIHPTRYRYVKLDCRSVKTHRVIWKMQTGFDPVIVDHKDRDRANNRWDNLRSANHNENARNSGIQKNSASGLRCVRRRGEKYQSYINKNGNWRSIGFYSTAQEAFEAYCAVARIEFGEFFSPG